ncbi:hypothetical protein [Loigolactobacillus jiayinensis]|uniref:Uncharacterized protein n=1 Tax=Loigolactobacillus jiayinensis TaxID=2486016 RepID=A0ABW1RG49_9LACO|nr:hypothetical protein [Loigolactobacillus jiayinensis]
MTFEGVVTDIVKTIKHRQAQPTGAQLALPVTFTHEHKIAAGCIVFIVEPDGSYQARQFDVRFPDIDAAVQAIYHAAYFECDADSDQMEPLIAAVKQQLTA